jgi:hypothetical protein
MCNGSHHQDGCECGFGPPYSYIKIVHYRIPSERAARKTSLAGRFHISIPVTDMPRPEALADDLHAVLVDSLEKQLGVIAQKSMKALAPTARLQATITALAAGSLEVHFDLIFVGGAIFAFFVKYPDFKKGVAMFRDDLVKQSRHVIKVVQDARKTRAENKPALTTLNLSATTTRVKEDNKELGNLLTGYLSSKSE